ncbi:extracellular solute-binding protein [Bacillus niameyensis]|uniref:extracellular solute-binding protein n=1 Tax=Bacillus niameyensis TaxID=1522308 RepID=UPI000841156B|nr:extracellular solute-binding protein [Bacillus niameyensis]
MKKLIFNLFMTMLVLTVIVGCSNGTSSPNNSTPDDTTSSNSKGKEQAETNGDRPTIVFYTNEHPSWPTNKEWLVWDLMEEGGNINLDIKIAPDPWAESLNLTIASGDLPDLLRMTYQLGNKYGQDGALINLLDHIDQMPNLKAWMEEYPLDARRAISHDGKMYTSPNVGIGETNRMLWLYRKDIFDKHGLEAPKNWDELYTVLTELKKQYPESYPFGFRNGTDKLVNFAPNFETSWNYYYDYDKDEWRYGPIEDNYRVMIEYMNKFYEEKLIPPDFLSTDTEQWQQLMSTDTSFITQDYIGRIDMFNAPNRETNPDYTIINMPPPAGFTNGKQLDYYAHINDAGYSVAVTTKNLEAVLGFIDWTFSEEGRDTLSWGVEGETYEVENGEKKWIQEYPSPSELRTDTGLSLFGTYSWFDYDAHMALFSDEVKKAYEDDPQYDAPVVPVPAFTDEEQEIIAIKGEAIAKHRDEEIAKFIIGKRDFSEWDAYVEEIKKLGIDEMLEIHTKAYKRMLEVELN